VDVSESVAQRYLIYRGLQVTYEPDGNVTPDFLADGGIAVEVRRLNQNEVTPSGLRGIEEDAIPLHMGMRTFLTSFGAPTSGPSWFVTYTVKRPLPTLKALRKILVPYLTRFKNADGVGVEREMRVDGAISVRLHPASDPQTAFFVPGGGDDHDAGGFVLSEMIRNVRLCIEEKTAKTSPFRSRYSEWWLVLVDRIGFGVDAFDQRILRQELGIHPDWDKIVLLDPYGQLPPFEL